MQPIRLQGSSTGHYRAVSPLHKATHFKVKETVHEESPVTSIRQLTKQTTDQVDARMYAAFSAICKTWLGLGTLTKARNDSLPFKLNGMIVINPRTGLALTNKEWKVIEADLRKLVSWVFGDTEEAIAKQAIALGKILTTMSLSTELPTKQKLNKTPVDRYLKNSVQLAQQSAGEYVTGVSSALKKDIRATIVESIKGKWGERELESALFDKFATRNRDFRMIAETELNTNANTSYLLTLLQTNKKNVFVKGMSNDNACTFCKANIHNQIFVLVKERPEDGDEIEVNGKTYTAIWPGKNNIHRNRGDWWSAVPAHPHCACWYTEYNPKFEKYHTELQERMEQMKEKKLAKAVKCTVLVKARKMEFTDKLGRTWKWNGSKYVYQKKDKGGLTPTVKVAQPKATGTKMKVAKDRESLPKHIQALKLPPAWTDIHYSPDPKADLLATGVDAKGRKQYVYSESFAQASTKAKFERINKMNQNFDKIVAQNNKAAVSGNESAVCLQLILQLAIRPGSDKDTKATKKAYGATTLEGRHVEVKGGNVALHFIGKKGIELNIPVTDKALAKMLVDRKKKAGTNGRLFGISSRELLEYTSSLDGGGFKTKDIRTYIATKTALQTMSAMPKPNSVTAYKKSVREVAKVVSSKLGNTPTVALQSYINPVIFNEWKVTE